MLNFKKTLYYPRGEGKTEDVQISMSFVAPRESGLLESVSYDEAEYGAKEKLFCGAVR